MRGPKRPLLQCLSVHVHRVCRHNKQVALLFVDLDEFQRINDPLGHMVGDRALEMVARTHERREIRDGWRLTPCRIQQSFAGSPFFLTIP